MPSLDFAVVCDFVRADKGVGHILGGGFDTIHVRDVPAAHNMGLWARIMLARNECDRPHRIEIIVQGEDGQRVVQVSGTFSEKWDESLPAHWKRGVGLAFNLGVPLPRLGLYSLEILVNDNLLKTIDLRVMQAPDNEASDA